MANSVSVRCINPECRKEFPLRYRSKNVTKRGMYCSRRCYGLFTPKMNEVYLEKVKDLGGDDLRPREFMAFLIATLNRQHPTWTARADILGISRLSYMHWFNKLKLEIVELERRGIIRDY